jgi:hypothetical protein
VANSYYERILSATCAQVAEEALREAWAAGRRLTAKQALAEAQALAHDMAPDSDSHQRGA